MWESFCDSAKERPKLLIQHRPTIFYAEFLKWGQPLKTEKSGGETVKERGESFTMLLDDSGRIRDSWGIGLLGPLRKIERESGGSESFANTESLGCLHYLTLQFHLPPS